MTSSPSMKEVVQEEDLVEEEVEEEGEGEVHQEIPLLFDEIDKTP